MDKGAESLQDLIRRRQTTNFVGREGELSRFAANLAYPVDDPRRRFVFSVHGDGGVGKTLLTRQLQRMAAEHGAIGGYVDEAVFSAPEAMAEFAGQLAGQGVAMKEFLRLAETYRQRRSEIEADPGAPTGIASFMTRTAARVGVEALRTLPAIGGLAAAVDGDAFADQADELRRFLGTKLRHEDMRMLLSPVEALTPTFVRELAAGSRNRPIMLFIDTYEQTGPFLDDWLRALLEGRYGQLPAELVITIAGREPLDRGKWSPYLSVLADVPLLPFNEIETRQLLSGRAIDDERLIEVILRLSDGLPLLVAMLAEQHPTDIGDPSGDAVERFLKWESDPDRRALAVTAALPRSLNEDILSELIDEDVDVKEAFAWLGELSFVTRQTGRCQYHAVVRGAMLRLERGQSPSRWQRLHQRLAAHHRALRTEQSEDGRDRWHDESWREPRLEECYHELCAQNGKALPAAAAALVGALDQGLDLAAACIQAIKQAGEDGGSAIVQQWGRRLDQARLAAEDEGIALLDLLIEDGGPKQPRLADALLLRGQAHRRLGRPEQALADLDRAIELNPDSSAIVLRAVICFELRRFEEASAGFSRGLEILPRIASPLLLLRGIVQVVLGNYEEALADFDLVDDADAAGTVAAFRGEAYRLLDRYDDALIHLDRAIELAPEAGVSWRWNRGATLTSLGRYEEALDEFDRALAEDANPSHILVQRGCTLLYLSRFEEAILDFDHALELVPGSPDALVYRGQAYCAVGRYAEAIEDLTAAIAADSEAVTLSGHRGRAYLFTDQYELALADLDRAVELDPENVHALADRAQTYRILQRFDEALADLDQVVELDPEAHRALAHRGETYGLLGRLDEALADFDRAIELQPDYTWAIGSRGESYRLAGRSEAALADLNRTIELKPDYAWAIAGRGRLHADAGRYEAAMIDFDHAIELEPDLARAFGGRGRLHADFGRYEEALADLVRATASDPGEDSYHYECALVWLRLENTVRASAALAMAQARLGDPTNILSHANAVLYLAAQRDFAEARKAASAFIDLRPKDYLVCGLLKDLGELREIPGFDAEEVSSLMSLLADEDAA